MATQAKSYFLVHDAVLPSGKTIKEANLELTHGIAIGTLVEVRYDNSYGGGACEKVHARLWVVDHHRDCDGTPMYGLSRWDSLRFAEKVKALRSGFIEESLTPVEITSAIAEGEDVLEWPESDTTEGERCKAEDSDD